MTSKSRPVLGGAFAGELKKKKTGLSRVPVEALESSKRHQKKARGHQNSLAAALQTGLAEKYKSTTLRSPTCDLNASVGNESWLDDGE